MPNYLFHVENPSGTNGDAIRRELLDEAGAIAEASTAAGEVLAEELIVGHSNPTVSVTVQLDDGTKVVVVRASGTIERYVTDQS